MTSLANSLSAPGAKKWEFATGGAIRSSAAVGANGLAYFGSLDAKLHAVEVASGAARWELAMPGAVVNSPALGENGTVYVASLQGHVAALDGATGVAIWTNRVPETLSSPALGANGLLYVATRARGMYALEMATGRVVWTNTFENWQNVYASPAIGADGTVFCASGGFELSGSQPRFFALDGETGSLWWSFASPNLMQATPAIGADGTVFIPSYDKFMYALDPIIGAKQWEHLTADALSSSPALSVDGTLYVGGNDGRLYALDAASGVERWTFLTGDTIHSSPTVDADGTVYFGSYDRHVYALDGATGAERWRFATGGLVLASPVLSADGTVVIGSYDGKLYALEGGAPPAGSPWPAFKGGAERTGSAHQEGLPVIVRSMPDRTESEGTSVSLRAVVGGSPPMRYQWRKGDRPLTNATGASLHISTARTGDSGNYTLIASNAYGETRTTMRLEIGYILSIPELGGGQVIRDPDRSIYLPGTVVTLTPTPVGTRRFLGWRGDASGIDSPLRVTMDRHKHVAAAFELAPGERVWEIPALVTESPVVVDHQNTVFLAGTFTNFHALDAGTGAIRWSIPITGLPRHTALAGDGRLIRTIDPNVVQALDSATGQQQWNATVAGYLSARPAIGADGTVYIPSENNGAARLTALAGATGLVKWRYAAGQSFRGTSPVLGATGLIYITTQVSVANACRWKLTAINPETGLLLWSFILGDCAGSAVTPGGEGAVYVVSSDGVLHALDGGTGQVLWTFRLASAALLPPTVGPGETIFALDERSNFIAIDGRTGRKRTEFRHPDGFLVHAVSPSLTADGALLALGSDRLVALDAATGRLRWDVPVPGMVSVPIAVGPDSTVYASTILRGQPRLTALKGTGPLAEAPWPTTAGDARNSGAANSTRPVRILRAHLSARDLQLTIWTRLAHAHHLEVSDSLQNSEWKAIATLTGTGTEQVVVHPQASAAARFYRVRIE